MNTYKIINTVSGQEFGTYTANDKAGALDAMARDAGYASHDEACRVTDYDGSEFLVINEFNETDAEALERRTAVEEDEATEERRGYVRNQDGTLGIVDVFEIDGELHVGMSPLTRCEPVERVVLMGWPDGGATVYKTDGGVEVLVAN